MTDVADEVEPAAEPERHAGALVTWSRGPGGAPPHPGDLRRDRAGARATTASRCASDVTSVDYLERPARDLPSGVAPERFEVVVNLVSFEPPRRIRVRVQVPESDPTVPTLWDLYPGVEFFEREVFDLMGIRFDGHPDLTRILMPEDWEGHPLRKDYPIGAVPVQFKAAPPTR